MVSRRGSRLVLYAAGLVGCGAVGSAAWQSGLWGLLAGTVLTTIWLVALQFWSVRKSGMVADGAAPAQETDHGVVWRMLLDAAPTPLLALEGETARALNRAARQQFGTEDRLLPVPAGLLDPAASNLRHEGRSWRIDRVDVTDAGPGRTVVALIDIEREERVAEARATAELVQVLGHELLNGLAPIVSLAESGLAAINRSAAEPALLSEILGTLARRAEGLQRFTEAYRELARLPAPSKSSVSIAELVADLQRLFASRWPEVALSVGVPHGQSWSLDRDQVSQAIWALLQNAAEAASAGIDPKAQVCVSARTNGPELVIEVSDNGRGLPPGSHNFIFRPFYTTKLDGTGIGLSLARQIAQAHGGMLALRATPCTTFRMVLPEP